MADTKPKPTDQTTQLDIGASKGARSLEDRAYVMVRSAGSALVHVVEPGEPLTLGRGDDADILVDDTRASRRHAELHLRDGRLFVRDLGSRNGTKVGGSVLVNGERAVVRGEEITIGPTSVTVVALPAASFVPEGASVVAESASMKELFTVAERLAVVPTPVLLRGETGVGKEIFAELIHGRGPRRSGPFIRLNAAAVPESLLESELFGHERGAFTGATERKRGYLELAHQGTLFLDEVGDLPLPLQAKLLRALETQRVARVGGREEIGIDARLISATHHDLDSMVESGAFRRDFYYRIAGFVLEIPPLRQRKDDIAPLALRFIAQFASKLGHAPPELTASAQQALEAHGWPGNVRELKNAVEHAIVLAGAAALEAKHLPRTVIAGAESGGSSMKEHVDSAERNAIERALDAAQGNRARAAEILGVSKRTLQYRLAKMAAK